RGNFGVFEFPLARLLEKLHVLGIGARPAAFNVMNSESIELFRDAQFVCGREIDAFALAAVAQGRIVNFDFGFHCFRLSGNKYLSESSPGGKSQNPLKNCANRARMHPVSPKRLIAVVMTAI